MSTEAWAGLGDAVSAIREELSRAIAEGDKSDLRFRSGPIELELAATIHTGADGKVKVSLLPWGVEAKADRANDRTQRIRFTLHPIDPATGADKLISDEVDERPR